MLAAALSIALLAAPTQNTAAWGQYEWDHGAGPLSRYYFDNSPGFPTGHELEYGTRAGSFHHLIFATGRGSTYFWDNGLDAGSAYFWRNGLEAGSRYYWHNGYGCLSDFGWRNGAVCDAPQALTFQSLCIARAVDVAPCRAINSRLEEWLERASSLSTGDPAAAIARMREAID